MPHPGLTMRRWRGFVALAMPAGYATTSLPLPALNASLRASGLQEWHAHVAGTTWRLKMDVARRAMFVRARAGD